LTNKPVADIHEIFFGAANTDVEFGNPATTGLLSVTLQLVGHIPNPNLYVEMNKPFDSPINWIFRQRHMMTRTSAEDGLDVTAVRKSVPQYLFVVAKGTADASQQEGAAARNFSLCRRCNMESVVVDLDEVKYPNDP
jgi:hypothetical protein